jgi:hypothetical protein
VNFATVFRAVDLLLMAGDAAKRLTGRRGPSPALSETDPVQHPAGWLETRLTGVLMSALKEAFARDHSRLEMEREQFEATRRQAEQALRLELRRQAGEREIGRLRLLSGAAFAGWIAAVALLAFRLDASSRASMAAVVVGWLLLLASLAASFTAQRRVSREASDPAEPVGAGAGIEGVAAVWLLVGGLAATAVSLLL